MTDGTEPGEHWQALSNWGRWGPDDELGTLNFITPEKRRHAASLVVSGVTISCGLLTEAGPQPGTDQPYQRYMHLTGEGWNDPHRVARKTRQKMNGIDKHAGASEFVGLNYHGLYITHLDALSHVFWDGRLYNDRPSELVNVAHGATVLDVTTMKDGVVSRGVLFDVPRHRGVEWLEPGERVTVQELEAIERETGVTVSSGDIILLRTGTGLRRREHGIDPQSMPGWDPACALWFRDREVALIGADSANDAVPAVVNLGAPLHAVAIPLMGLTLLDNCDLERLSEHCARTGRNEFMFIVAPLTLDGMTGSPVNPIAIV